MGTVDEDLAKRLAALREIDAAGDRALAGLLEDAIPRAG
jgi:hypothetical protein